MFESASQRKSPSIFIAYSRQDQAAMRRVRDWLRSAGFDVWTDEDLAVGTVDWQRSIQRTIDQTDYMLVLLSPDAVRSDWVIAEIEYARIQNTRVLPILVRGSFDTSVPQNLITVNVLDVRENFDGAMANLIAALMQGISAPVRKNDAPETTPPPATKWKFDVFLSYSHDDSVLMQNVKNSLTIQGLQVWTDETLLVGTASWLREIAFAIENAGCLVGILSPSAKSSEWVQEELNYARMQERRRFLLLALGSEKNAIPFGVAQVQFADIRQDFSEGMQKAVADIKAFLGIS